MKIQLKRICGIVLLGLSLTLHQNTHCWGFSFSPAVSLFCNKALQFVQSVPSLIKSSPGAKAGALVAATLGAVGLAAGCFVALRLVVRDYRAEMLRQRNEQAEDVGAASRTPRMLDLIDKVVQQLPELAQDEFGYIEAKVLPAGSHIAVIGDLHGDPQSLTNNLRALTAQGILDGTGHVVLGNYIVCLGDVADRGPDGVLAWQALLELKNKNPDLVTIVRGNHEYAEQAERHGLWEELLLKFRFQVNDVANAFVGLWRKLPHAVYLGMRSQMTGKVQYVQFCHGGIETRLAKPTESALRSAIQNNYKSCRKFRTSSLRDSEELEALCGLNWSDFEVTDTVEPHAGLCARACNSRLYTYNAAFARDYLNKMSGDDFEVYCIVRGHDHIEGGIVELRDQLDTTQASRSMLQQWRPLQHGQVETIRQGAVFTCTSSPAGLGGRSNCYEDAYAVIGMGADGLQIRPHIVVRH